MDIRLNLYPPFVAALNRMREKYGERFERYNALHNDNLNFTGFISNFVDSDSVADVSPDANANSSSHDVRTMLADMTKPHTKLLGFNKIFYEMTKRYGLETAEKWLENEWNGAFYGHDFATTTLYPYCYAMTLRPVVDKGLYFINHFRAQPARHFDSFNEHVRETICWMANRQSGAVGVPDYLIYAWWYWQNDVKSGYTKDPERYRDQQFQSFIYSLNQPFMRISECAFTNVSIFDREYLMGLFGGTVYPDGTMAVDHIEELVDFEKAFMTVIKHTRREMMFTFPVLTYALLYQDHHFIDEDFARWAVEFNREFCDANFFVGNDVTVLSNCCFDGDTMILAKDSGGVKHMTIKEYFELEARSKKNPTVFHDGSWVKAKAIRLPGRKMYRVKTANNKEIVVTDNHLHPVLTVDGKEMDVETRNLTTDDYLLFNTSPLNGLHTKDAGLTYEQGVLIGAYLGDGSMFKNGGAQTDVNYSLNEQKYSKLLPILTKAFTDCGIDADIALHKLYNNVYPVVIHSDALAEFIRMWVDGSYANEKELNMDCLLQSVAFRNGIKDGFYMTDGGNSCRIYTTSKSLAGQMEALLTSLGLQSIIDVSDRTDEPVIIRGESFNRNFPLYCVRWYDSGNRRCLKDVYTLRNGRKYYKITSIEPLDDVPEFVYCFEVADQSAPYFTLPNGIITHNCRLLSDTSKLKGFINSIGGTSLEIGSIKVNTINLHRIALEAEGDEEKYMQILRERTVLCIQFLDTVRHILKRNVEKGLLPNYTYNLIDFDKQYSTIGVLGVYEAVNEFGLIRMDQTGNHYYTDEGIAFAERILATVNEVKDAWKSDCSYNIESVPAERAAVVLANKDNELYPNQKDKYFILSNQWIPLMEKCTIHEKIRVGSYLDKACNGGVIAHINLEGDFASFEQAWDTINYIADQGVLYFAFNRAISVCEHEHSFYGETCPKCGGKKKDTYCRVVGFLTPVSSYSKERRQEFDLRKWFKIGNDMY